MADAAFTISLPIQHAERGVRATYPLLRGQIHREQGSIKTELRMAADNRSLYIKVQGPGDDVPHEYAVDLLLLANSVAGEHLKPPH